MRTIVITAILLSACISIQNKKRLEINQDQCNVDDREDYYYSINLKFTSIVKDADNISISASTLAPCAFIDDFRVKVNLHGIKTVMTFNSNRTESDFSQSGTEEMSMNEMAEWWNGFVKEFKQVVVGAHVVVDNDLAEITIEYMDPKLLMHLEALKLPFVEGVYEYDLDEMVRQKQPKREVVIKEQTMTPEMLEMFKNQLMTQENMQKMLEQFKTGQGTIQTMTPEGNQIQMVIQRQIVSTINEKDKDRKQFLI